jgi:DNA-binding NarL/FixJ family response regulator
VTVVVGVDGTGRTHRLDEIAATIAGPVVRVTATSELPDLDAVAAAGTLVIVDDAHRLDGAGLRALATAAKRGVPMAIARRPTIDRPELADLDEAVAAQGQVEQLGPLSDDALAALVAKATGKRPAPELVAAVRAASSGMAAVAAAIAAGPTGGPPPALVARVQRRLALLDPAIAGLARTLALQMELSDEVIADAARLDLPGLARAMRLLRDEGMLVPGGERMIPAIAEAILTELSPTERRRIHDTVAQALLAVGADALVAAEQLRAARVRTKSAAEAYRAAGERLRFADPAAALHWFDDAADAGAEPAALAAGRAEASVLLGRPVDLDSAAPASAAETVRLALVDGAVAAHDGRAPRAAMAFLVAGPLGQALAVVELMATGRPDEARVAGAAASEGGHAGLRRLAEAALATGDPAAALPLLIEAAEAIERNPPALVLPDTPHALAALVAVTAGDAASAEHLLERALAARLGGAAGADRHRLLLAWVRMRSGRYDAALGETRRLAKAQLAGRDRLLLASVAAGIARRSGDVARLRATWAGVEPVLARRAIDLFQTEPIEELLVAAARLRHHQRIAPVVDGLNQIVDRLGRPPAWEVTVGWIRLQVAIASEDAEDAAAVADRMGSVGAAGRRQQAQRAAAARWAETLAGTVDPDGVLEAVEQLADAELPWEASRLAGQAAIRATNAGVARRLLERARELSSAEATAAESGPDTALAGLSEREVEVARLVLAGRTHREIGAQLYISPKTVEHHVARIRTKLGATTRAEFVAAIREALGDEAVS